MSLKDLARKVQDWRSYRASVRDLARLSDRELADLGLRRCDIEFAARTAQRHCA